VRPTVKFISEFKIQSSAAHVIRSILYQEP